MIVLYDGNDEVLLTQNCVMHELTTEDTIKLYQTSLIYRNVIKDFLKQEESNSLEMRLRRVNLGIETLRRRLIQDLGEETALHIAAKTSLDILLSDINLTP